MADKPLPKLTTTSFAILGLLQRRPWSAYELTRFMRNPVLRAVWPRAESHLYSEPKLLLKRGYVAAHQEQNRQPRQLWHESVLGVEIYRQGEQRLEQLLTRHRQG